jgi:hypothetical protein
VLIGTAHLPIPDHPRIRHLGFLPDRDKFDAIAAAEALVMPSYFESLSMVALEAWALGKPVLANGRCDVLRGQAVRSNGGLYYENYGEFAEAVRVLDSAPHVASTLGENGSRFFRAHYAWPVIERKYLDMFEQLSKQDAADIARRPAPELPGWWGRRQKTLPPAREVLAGLPLGPVLGREPREARGPRDERDGREPRDPRQARDVRPPRPAASAPPSPPPAAAPPMQGRSHRRDDSRNRGRDGRDGRAPRSPQGGTQNQGGKPTSARPATPPGTPRPAGGTAPPAGDGQAPRGHRGGRQRRGRRPGDRPARKSEA